MVCKPLTGNHGSLLRKEGRRLSEKGGGVPEISQQKGRGSRVQSWRRTTGKRTRAEVKEQNRHRNDNETQNTKRSPNAKSKDHSFNTPRLHADLHDSSLSDIWEVFTLRGMYLRAAYPTTKTCQ